MLLVYNDHMTERNLEQINQSITDRSNCFYWQTDRAIDPGEAGAIFTDRHASVGEPELTTAASEAVGKELSLVAREEVAQNDLGNVNIVRELTDPSGKHYIMRTHPKGLVNGYFWAEAAAASLLKKHNLPGYEPYKVQDIDSEHSFAFMIIEKLPGTAIKTYLEEKPEDETELTFAAGAMMARMHQLKISGFGFFDNERAKSDGLHGIKPTFREHVLAGLDFNLKVLVEQHMLSTQEATKTKTFFETSSLPDINQGVLVHNDFADWNLLTDGKDITGILDLDEAFSGDPIADLACWTTFHGMERYKEFIKGYQSLTELPADYEDRLWFYRLRYLVSKLTLRTRRLTWDFGPLRGMLEEKVATGRTDLEETFNNLAI